MSQSHQIKPAQRSITAPLSTKHFLTFYLELIVNQKTFVSLYLWILEVSEVMNVSDLQ